MYTLTEEQRWYIIIEWKKGSINVSQVARSFNCSLKRGSARIPGIMAGEKFFIFDLII
jgi:hypothetical protein